MPDIIRNVEDYVAKMRLLGLSTPPGDDPTVRDPQREDSQDDQVTKKIAEHEMARIAIDISNGKLKVPVTYEDGDQSPLTGSEAILLHHKWASGMDYQPHAPFFDHFSPFMLACYHGNYTQMMKLVKAMSKAELDGALRTRETLLRVSPIFHPIIGALNIMRNPPNRSLVMQTSKMHGPLDLQHSKVLAKLVELGAEVNVHDVAGYTPLHYCFSRQDVNVVYEMGKKLVAKGAKVNAVNRFGATPLMAPVRGKDLEATKLLLQLGADPSIKDLNGVSPFDIGREDCSSGLGWLLKVGDQQQIAAQRADIKKAGGMEQCSVCAKSCKLRCTGCFVQWYCSAQCQRSDWANHKTACKATKAEYLQADFSREHHPDVSYNMDSGKAIVGAKPKTVETIKHCVVKVQVCLTNRQEPMMVYNEDRSIFGVQPVTTELGAKLKTAVETRGFQGIKGFFNAMKKKGNVFINPSILPPEAW